MYNNIIINNLCAFILERNGIADKQELIKQVQDAFGLTEKRSIFVCNDFAIRFCTDNNGSFSNTVLSLSKLKDNDNLPLIVCVVTPNSNKLYLANSTFLRKISHSSQGLTRDKLRGSFNGSDIIRDFEGIKNEPNNFGQLFALHENNKFDNNLERLVAETNKICPTGTRFEPTERQVSCIMHSVERAMKFMQSEDYCILSSDLQQRINYVAPYIDKVKTEYYNNVNLRGRTIEYLITHAYSLDLDSLDAISKGSFPSSIYTANNLGDYKYNFNNFNTETDIKTKVLCLSSNPKGYNIDKLLEFLATEKSVYLICIVAIGENQSIVMRLCSMYNCQILNGTRINNVWTGRDSRGATQYDGHALESIICDFDSSINEIDAKQFIRRCIDL